jgi:hypothetical protein
VQQLLIRDDISGGVHTLMPLEKLIDLALTKLMDAYDIDKRVNIPDESVVFENTAKLQSGKSTWV